MMVRYLLNYAILAIFAFTLTACEQQKKASTEVGAIPKTIIDKATNDINAAQALASEKRQAIEGVDAPADVVK